MWYIDIMDNQDYGEVSDTNSWSSMDAVLFAFEIEQGIQPAE